MHGRMEELEVASKVNSSNMTPEASRLMVSERPRVMFRCDLCIFFPELTRPGCALRPQFLLMRILDAVQHAIQTDLHEALSVKGCLAVAPSHQSRFVPPQLQPRTLQYIARGGGVSAVRTLGRPDELFSVRRSLIGRDVHD